ncbi:HAMP domain-containing protein [Paenibacillaceae bacterium]|nr:HAMP domain-containing protein [Paenibacillaceae bacterium]
MKRAGLLRRLWKPGSLRNELLARSLLVLAALLLLIGVFQYIVMKDFLYRNKAEALEAQILALPRGILADWARPGIREQIAGGGSDASSAAEAPALPGIPPYGRDNPHVLLPPGTSLATVDEEESFTDLIVENGTPAPRLTDVQYERIKEQLKQRVPAGYQLLTDSEGNEQLVVFRYTAKSLPGGSQLLIQMGVGTSSMKDILHNQLLIFSSLALLALLAGTLVYLPVLRRALVPLSNAVQTVEKTDAGNLNERLPLQQGQAEIDLLARSFNNMLDRLELSFEAEREAKEQMRRFVADASHELRTPLTSIHGFVDVLRRGAADHPEQRSAALRSMHGETKRLNALVGDLLTLARLDQTPSLHKQPVRLDLLISDMQPQLRLMAGKRRIELEIATPTVIHCEADKIKQALLNLFHNAVQHTDPDNGIIAISLFAEAESGGRTDDAGRAGNDDAGRSGIGVRFHDAEKASKRYSTDDTEKASKRYSIGDAERAVSDDSDGVAERAASVGNIGLTVADNGPGIKEEHQAKVFERFYRSDASRARKDGGSGLGLAITKAIIEAHGGSISVDNSGTLSGASFHIKLPRA